MEFGKLFQKTGAVLEMIDPDSFFPKIDLILE